MLKPRIGTSTLLPAVPTSRLLLEALERMPRSWGQIPDALDIIVTAAAVEQEGSFTEEVLWDLHTHPVVLGGGKSLMNSRFCCSPAMAGLAHPLLDRDISCSSGHGFTSIPRGDCPLCYRESMP